MKHRNWNGEMHPKYVEVKGKRVKWVAIDLNKVKKYLEMQLPDREIARRLHLTADYFEWYKLREPAMYALYNDTPRTWGAVPDDAQWIYDKWVEYKKEREEKGLDLSIPSLCAYMHIARETFNKYLEVETPPQWIDTEEGKAYVSRSDLFKNFMLWIESSLNDFAAVNKSVGAIFLLKNHFGYRDERSVQIGKDEPINITWQSSPQIEGKKPLTIEGAVTVKDEKEEGTTVSDNVHM